MKKTLFILLAVVALLSAAALANNDAPAAANATVGVLPYDDLRQVIPIATLGEKPINDIRARAAELDGQVVELQGPIIGVVANGATRRVVMEVGERTTLLTTIPDLDASYAVALKSGAFARVLARVQAPTPAANTAGNGDAGLLILAATNRPAAPVTSTLPVAPAEAALPADGELPLPPMAALSEAEPANKPQAALVQIAADPAADPLAQFIATYKPLHEAIVRRHNKNLKDAQVDQIATAILTAGYKYNMDPRFLAAIIAVESDFDIYCLSKSGAMGLGQLMPFNLKEAGVTNPWDPTQNIMGTAKLLRGHLDDYKGRANATLLAVAAYNAGPGAVRRAGYQVPDGAQVRRYVWKVYYRYKAFAPDMFN
jgi:soluble lytic murein transglycosylase-like protein